MSGNENGMIWNASEEYELRALIARIGQYRGFRCASVPKGTLCLNRSDAEELKAHLADQTGGAILVRHLTAFHLPRNRVLLPERLFIEGQHLVRAPGGLPTQFP
jgi:hypothetical protein